MAEFNSEEKVGLSSLDEDSGLPRNLPKNQEPRNEQEPDTGFGEASAAFRSDASSEESDEKCEKTGASPANNLQPSPANTIPECTGCSAEVLNEHISRCIQQLRPELNQPDIGFGTQTERNERCGPQPIEEELYYGIQEIGLHNLCGVEPIVEDLPYGIQEESDS